MAYYVFPDAAKKCRGLILMRPFPMIPFNDFKTIIAHVGPQ
jgi:hypothetical protein